MPGTQVRMDRSTTVVNGTNKYQILATCVVKGTLPDTAIFVLQIQTAADPKDDTLLRLATIADMTASDTNRTAQVAAGLTTWRSNSVLLKYDDIATANAAWKELSGRINDLVDQVDTYLDEFKTLPTGQTIVYPSLSFTAEETLKTTYYGTVTALSTSEKLRDDEQEECTNLKNEIAIIQERLTEANADLATYTSIQAQLTAQLVAYQTIQPAIVNITNSIRIANSTSTDATSKALINTQLALADSQNTAFQTNNISFNTTVGGPVTSAVTSLQSRVASLTTDLTTTQSQFNLCNVRAVQAQAAVDAARAARDAALAAVRSVCPDFIP